MVECYERGANTLDTKKQFDDVALEYDFVSTLFNNNDFFMSNLPECRNRAIDIGCGSGVLTERLVEAFQEVVGIDISETMLAIARSTRQPKNVSYLNMNAESMYFNMKFDFVVSRTTLHHIKNKKAVLENMKTFLNPGGKIVILDNVSEIETPKRYAYLVGAYFEFIPNVIKYGLKTAKRVFKHNTSESWLEHLACDKYLSEEKTRRLYNDLFPNCELHKMGCFMGVVWKKGTT